VNDQKEFDRVLSWSNRNLLQSNGLYAWKYQKGNIVDQGFAPDADQDIALALLFAYKKWHNPQYLKQAQSLLNAIWNESVITIKNKPYLLAGNWADRGNEIIVNPSYFSPAAYKIFAEVDTNHHWLGLSETSYDLLKTCTEASLGQDKGLLPPEWCAVNKNTLRASQPTGEVPQGTDYGYNAFRIPWRVALDYQWHKEIRAKEYLSTLSFLKDEWDKGGKLSAVYTHSGDISEEYETASVYGGNLAYFTILYPTIAKKIYEEKLLSKLYEDKDRSYWEDPKNYYTQNWAWFGTAMYTNNLPNLWRDNSQH
jgi:endoglucanase